MSGEDQLLSTTNSFWSSITKIYFPYRSIRPGSFDKWFSPGVMRNILLFVIQVVLQTLALRTTTTNEIRGSNSNQDELGGGVDRSSSAYPLTSISI